MAKKWSELRHKSDSEKVAQAKQQQERTYNRPWWRLLRLWDRLKQR